jgi:hypothetical protein
MTVSLDWLARINVTINTTVFQAPTFQNCMIMGVFPTADRPDGTGDYVTNWGTNLYYTYSNYTDIATDFTVNYDAAIAATQWAQAFKYQILIQQAFEFFSQEPTPQNLIVACIDNTAGGSINYVTAFNNIITQNNDFYAFTIADQITATQINTATTGISAALAGLTSNKNLKVCFLDTADMNTGSGSFLFTVTDGGIGNPRMMLFAHTSNPQTAVPSAAVSAPIVCLGAANMGAYFTNLFTSTVGLKTISGQTLKQTASDSIIDDAKLNSLIAVNGNVYPRLGISTVGYMQYGYMASSSSTALLYLDQVVGADWIKLNVQADLVSYLLSQQPTGGVPYSDVGIQNLNTVFKSTLQRAVGFGIIQPFSNANVTAVPYALVSNDDKTDRIYRGLAANLTYLSRIQRLEVGITLGL